ncbi:hypothetical protein [Pedobacter sp. R20-19]|uniref:hypothetical protein n=1 Tax=Pedobacter sp. R20-19 TaxID=1270196 RepID=UPI0004930D37|nr:hypothetical protein [Pedobacter sp. R20-19]
MDRSEILYLLGRIRNHLYLNANNQRNLGYKSGLMGTAMLLFHYSRYFKNKSDYNLAVELMEVVFQVGTNNMSAPDLMEISSSITHIAREEFIKIDLNNLLQESDQILIGTIEQSNDLFYLAETGSYMVNRLKDGCHFENSLSAILNKLLDHAEKLSISKPECLIFTERQLTIKILSIFYKIPENFKLNSQHNKIIADLWFQLKTSLKDRICIDEKLPISISEMITFCFAGLNSKQTFWISEALNMMGYLVSQLDIFSDVERIRFHHLVKLFEIEIPEIFEMKLIEKGINTDFYDKFITSNLHNLSLSDGLCLAGITLLDKVDQANSDTLSFYII